MFKLFASLLCLLWQSSCCCSSWQLLLTTRSNFSKLTIWALCHLIFETQSFGDFCARLLSQIIVCRLSLRRGFSLNPLSLSGFFVSKPTKRLTSTLTKATVFSWIRSGARQGSSAVETDWEKSKSGQWSGCSVASADKEGGWWLSRPNQTTATTAFCEKGYISLWLSSSD